MWRMEYMMRGELDKTSTPDVSLKTVQPGGVGAAQCQQSKQSCSKAPHPAAPCQMQLSVNECQAWRLQHAWHKAGMGTMPSYADLG